MSTARLQHSGRAPDRLRSIGEVIAELRPEFPDLSPSKLRFLESEGLVTPARLANGYRKYGESHIERLRVVLTLQRDQYLPLKVIREKLELFDQGIDVLPKQAPDIQVVVDDDEPEAAPGPSLQGNAALAELARGAFIAGPGESVDREELLQVSGLTRRQLGELEEMRLVQPQPSGRYDEDAVMVAALSAQLFERGMEPRHIRAARFTVDREIGTVEPLLAGNRKRRGSSEDGAEALAKLQAELAGALIGIHAALLRSELRRL